MSHLIEIGNIAIRQDKEGRYSLNDLHKAAGGEKRHQPSDWLSLQQTQELVQEILTTQNLIPGISGIKNLEDEDLENGELKIEPVVAVTGRYGGTYVCKELVYSYAMWISPAFHLKVIRTFDAVVSGKTDAPTQTITATKLFRPFFQIARMIGCDKNAAAISANQAVQTVSGQNVLALLGHTHLEAQNQDGLFFTPTELGKKIGTTGRGFNLLLAEAGFQAKRGEHWEVMDAGREFAKIYDTGKRHGSGIPIQQIKWADAVLPLLNREQAV